MPANPLANLSRCAQCGLTGDATLFEPFNNTPGNVACKATAACEVRQSGQSAAYTLSVLLRAVRGELQAATTYELASLLTDLEGYGDAVAEAMSGRPDSLRALREVREDREARAARKSAKS
jgi:uncharacterized protein (DUF2342 family)